MCRGFQDRRGLARPQPREEGPRLLDHPKGGLVNGVHLNQNAPVTKQSGKTRIVQKRRACPHFMKQSFHEFADHARLFSDWSGAYYPMLQARGKRHNAAVRSLAFK